MGKGKELLIGGGDSQEKIFVSVRVRPLNKNEILNNELSDWECINDNTILYKNDHTPIAERTIYPAAYTFDKVFGEDRSTREVYEQGAKEVALAVVMGINSSVFAYGQTSSGKTYTMTGITRYTIKDIFKYMQKHTERKFVLKFSAMEIYNESVRDLLSVDATPLRLLDDPERGTIVDKLIEDTISDQNHLLQLVSICAEQRQIGETYLNEKSSRSHQIIRLNFVDLAGSERASQAVTAGTRLKEGGYINRSLLTLSSVIRKLSHGRNEHIPYRDSKLTRILQPSLGGNAKTAMICTISPARTHVEQSRNTLLFASCAKEVTTSAQVNVVMSDKTLVKHLQKELARLESELQTPGSFSTLLRQKDLRIEMLEKEVKDLILQRHIVQSQLKEALQLIGDETDSVQQLEMGNYPSLRMRVSPELVKSQATELRDSPEIDVMSCSAYSRSTSASRFTPAPNFKETLKHVSTSPRPEIGNSNYIETDSVEGWGESEIQSSGISKDLYKEVRSIEKEDHSSKKSVKYNYLYPENLSSFPGLKGFVSNNKENQRSLLSITNNDGKLRSPEVNVDRGVVSVPTRKDEERVSGSLGEGKMESSFTEKKELTVHEDVASCGKLSPEKDVDSLCNWLDNSQANQSENAEREADQIATMSVKQDNLGTSDNKKAELSVRSFKDVGLNHIEDQYRSLQSWPAEFKMLQKEIIDLWHSCHASLLHRTYFFLIIQGDPTDAVYMTIELRRLTCLKDTFDRGEKTVIGGKKMSLESSKKVVRQERRMLSMQMLKKLSDEERDMWFLKWRIGVKTKLRRLQLANRLWTNTEDINHIQDSARLVAKLIGFIERDQTPEEIFKLDLSPQPSPIR
ncbi:hypothetical protein Leryth_008198 [Lithospermum erythrorhizon]|nr:hypothetical protein Leryth_008198 [Lithospermum erythrorhizon]